MPRPIASGEVSSHGWFFQKGEYSSSLRLLWHVAHIEAKRAGKIRSGICSSWISSFVRGDEIIGWGAR